MVSILEECLVKSKDFFLERMAYRDFFMEISSWEIFLKKQ